MYNLELKMINFSHEQGFIYFNEMLFCTFKRAFAENIVTKGTPSYLQI